MEEIPADQVGRAPRSYKDSSAKAGPTAPGIGRNGRVYVSPAAAWDAMENARTVGVSPCQGVELLRLSGSESYGCHGKISDGWRNKKLNIYGNPF